MNDKINSRDHNLDVLKSCGFRQQKNTTVFIKGKNSILSPAVAEASNSKYWIDIREANLKRLTSNPYLLVRIVPNLFIFSQLQQISSLLSPSVMDNRPKSGNVWGIHIEMNKSTMEASLHNLKNSTLKIPVKLLSRLEIVSKLKNLNVCDAPLSSTHPIVLEKEIDKNINRIKELLTQHREILAELENLGVCSTGNNPLGDFAEWVACQEFELERMPNSTKGYDAVCKVTGERYQIKSRTYETKRTSYPLGAIRNLDSKPFDHLIVLLVKPTFDVAYTLVIPHEDIASIGKYRQHTNAHIITLNQNLIDTYKL
ncbi:hypothetical protein MGMO_97c00160 [Methyloglobulus morosus KoM1]|uniref:DUF6998 domain-containing protein n=1 Tax=Methyloglobulus morosus KoM1 TaxID=1116472 RepID=V5C469_9GAMM|nr:hypothetical protein [Methyloglobulus morosus]ESS71538.1 hypothetical protein MGMO_97c00160 [Methyloglobulus morosus KoM1]